MQKTARIIDGKTLAVQLRARIKQTVNDRLKQNRRAPGLAVILVDHDPASKIYVDKKCQACDEVGFLSQTHHLANSVSTAELLTLIDSLNADNRIDGILVQLPLPPHIDTAIVLEQIRAHKDVDGLHPYNLGRLAQRRPLLRPCTPYGIMHLLNSTGMALSGLTAVVISASNIVGKPMALELLLAQCTVTVCHRFTRNLAEQVQGADIVVSAVGKAGLIKGSWIKPQAVVIDVGINRLDNGKITGDVDFASAQTRASWITPVPGGVGPMTVAMLLQNTLLASNGINHKA